MGALRFPTGRIRSNPQVIQVIIQSVLYLHLSLVECKGISDYSPYLFDWVSLTGCVDGRRRIFVF